MNFGGLFGFAIAAYHIKKRNRNKELADNKKNIASSPSPSTPTADTP
jgi:hypothetical protein